MESSMFREAVYPMRDAAMQVSVNVGPSLDISGPNQLKSCMGPILSQPRLPFETPTHPE